jgi:hypothetical protein
MKKIFLFAITFSILWLGSCDSMLDVNSDPGKFSPDEATLPTLIPSAQRFTATSLYSAAQYGSQYTQHMAGSAIGTYTPYGFDGLWSALYTDALPTLQDVIEKGEEAGAYKYTAVARTLLALNVMNAADVYGDIPYTEANQGPADLYPCYDPMADVYNIHIIKLLEDALADYKKPNTPIQTSLQTVRNDLIYGEGAAKSANLTKWEKATHAILARYYLHLSEKDAKWLTNAISEAKLAFTSNADDLQLTYDAVTVNPWYTFVGNATNKSVQPGAYLVNLLNGKSIFQNVIDPRLSLYMTRSGTNLTYVGLPAGANYNTNGANVNATNNNWPFQQAAPVVLVSYAEMQFILAEAQFNTSIGDAYTAYLAGIKASLEKAGASVDAINTYLANPEVSMGSANLTLADVMLQKYLALYLQIEVWTDMRRYQYDPSVYVGMVKPLGNVLANNPWVQRSKLADEEPGVNTCLPVAKTQDVPLWLFE